MTASDSNVRTEMTHHPNGDLWLSDEQIATCVEEIARMPARDERARRTMLACLDSMAEQLVGRTAAHAQELKDRTQTIAAATPTLY